MKATISKRFTFEAAHRLPHVPDGHKCGRLHGHSFEFEVFVSGEVDSASGFVIDYADIGAACKPLETLLDHSYLNEIPGLQNPTSETLAAWLWERIAPILPILTRIVVKETCNTSCAYEGATNDHKENTIA